MTESDIKKSCEFRIKQIRDLDEMILAKAMYRVLPMDDIDSLIEERNGKERDLLSYVLHIENGKLDEYLASRK